MSQNMLGEELEEHEEIEESQRRLENNLGSGQGLELASLFQMLSLSDEPPELEEYEEIEVSQRRLENHLGSGQGHELASLFQRLSLIDEPPLIEDMNRPCTLPCFMFRKRIMFLFIFCSVLIWIYFF